METAYERLLSWARSSPVPRRVVGLRDTSDTAWGRKLGPCVVCYVDTMGGFLTPDLQRYEPAKVVASGQSWDEVAAKLGV